MVQEPRNPRRRAPAAPSAWNDYVVWWVVIGVIIFVAAYCVVAVFSFYNYACG